MLLENCRMSEAFHIVIKDLKYAFTCKFLYGNQFFISKNSFYQFFQTLPKKTTFDIKSDNSEILSFREYDENYFMISHASTSSFLYDAPETPKDAYEIF